MKRQFFVVQRKVRLLNDKDLIADEGDGVVLILDNCFDTEDDQCDRKRQEDNKKSLAEALGDKTEENTEKNRYCSEDRDQDSVINVVLNEGVELLGCYEQTDKEEQRDVSQDGKELGLIRPGLSRSLHHGLLIGSLLHRLLVGSLLHGLLVGSLLYGLLIRSLLRLRVNVGIILIFHEMYASDQYLRI